MPGQGRLGDCAQNPADAHGCPGCPHPAYGPAIAGSPNVNVNGRPAVRVGDAGMHAACCGPNTWQAMLGSATVFLNGKNAHRMNDQTRHCGGLGRLVQGSPDVIVGGPPSQGGGGGSSGGGSGGGEAGSGSGDSDTPTDNGDGDAGTNSGDTGDQSNDESPDERATDESTDDKVTDESTDETATDDSTDEKATDESTGDKVTDESTGDGATNAGGGDPATVAQGTTNDWVQAGGRKGADLILRRDDPRLSDKRKKLLKELDIRMPSTEGQPAALGKKNLFDNAPRQSSGTSCGLLPTVLLGYGMNVGMAPNKKFGVFGYGTGAVEDEGIHFGAWVTPDGKNLPIPGDIYLLREAGDDNGRSAAHVGIICDVDTSESNTWQTGDAGQDQGTVRMAFYCTRPWKKQDGTHPYLKGEHTQELRRIGGWVDLDVLLQAIGK